MEKSDWKRRKTSSALDEVAAKVKGPHCPGSKVRRGLVLRSHVVGANQLSFSSSARPRQVTSFLGLPRSASSWLLHVVERYPVM